MLKAESIPFFGDRLNTTLSTTVQSVLDWNSSFDIHSRLKSMTSVSITKVLDRALLSEFIVCEGEAGEQKLPAIVKITYPRKSETIDTKGYNSGLAEQFMYSYFSSKAAGFTPHVAKFLSAGEQLSLKFDVGSLTKFTAQTKSIMDMNTNSDGYGKLDMEKPVSIATEKLKGSPLNDWVHYFVNNRPPQELSAFLYDVLFQIAYTLLVFEDLGIMHNNLHTGKIFVHHRPTKLSYETRPGCTVDREVQYYVKIVDFDHGSKSPTRMDKTVIHNNYLGQGACESLGACNEYRPNADWFTIISYLYSESKWETLERIFPVDLLQNTTALAFRGHLCYCVEGGGNMGCTKCGQIDAAGVTLMSPATFLEHSYPPGKGVETTTHRRPMKQSASTTR